MRTCILLLLVMCAFPTVAQTGPGGVGNTTGTSSLLLWLNADALSDVYDGNNVTNWEDASGYAHHASQSGGSNKPNLRRNFINGFNALSFNGTAEYLDGSLGPFQAPCTMFTAGYYSQLNQPSADNDYIFSLGNTSASGYNRMSSARVGAHDTGNANKFVNNSTDANLLYGSVITGQEWVITTQIYNTSSPFFSAYLNGIPQAITGNYTSALTNEGNYSVGRYRNAGTISSSHLLNGYVGEVICFNRVLNTAERNLVTTYLAAKYNKSVADDKYIGDDPVNGNHDRDVAGIGQEPDGANTMASSASLTLITDSNMGNGDYVILGHNTITNSVNTTDIDLGSLQGRWNRVWWMDVTDAGAAVSVNLTFDFSESGFGGVPAIAANYQLIFRSGTSGAWSNIAVASSVIGDRILFSNVPVSTSGDGYYTLATVDVANSTLGIQPLGTISNGPGGIGSTDGTSALTLWLNASRLTGDSDDPVVTWGDESGNGYDASAVPDGNNYPSLQTNVVNGHHAVNFNFNHYFSGSMANLDAPATIVAVPYFEQLNQANVDYVFRVGQNGILNGHTSIARRGSPEQNRYSSWDGTANRLGANLAGQTWMVLTQYLNPSGTFHDLYIDGIRNTPVDFTSTINTNGLYEVGRFEGNQHFLLGNVAELIVYDKVLNAAELAILHSSIAAKYNITVNNDKYDGDSPVNGDYDLDVAGVGQSDTDGGSALAGSNTMASSAGMTLSIVSNFQNGDFVVAGHKVSNNDINTTDITSIPTGLQGRWERVWYIDVTDAGGVVAVDVIFDFSSAGFNKAFAGGLPSNYKLLFRGGQAGDWSVLASGSSYQSDQLVFSNVELTQDGYIALGSINISSSPLPVGLMSFESKPNTNGTLLRWRTASEVKLDHFEIQRSVDGIHFQVAGKVKGINDMQGAKYEFTDLEFTQARMYYRLRIVDFDGQHEYSNVIVVDRDITSRLAFPNPVTGVANLPIEENQEIMVIVVDQLGRELDRQVIIPNDWLIKVDLSSYASGVYLVRLVKKRGTETVRLFKK